MRYLTVFLFICFINVSFAAGGYWRVKMNYTIDGVEKYGDCFLDYMDRDSVEFLKSDNDAFLNYLNRHAYTGELHFYKVIRYRGMPEVQFFPLWDTGYQVQVEDIEAAELIGLEVTDWGYKIVSDINLSEDSDWLKSDFTKLDYDQVGEDEPGCHYYAYDHGCHPYGRELYRLFLTLEYDQRRERAFLLEVMRKHQIVVISWCGC